MLLRGLKSLEYRGYDSAGLALCGDRLHLLKDAGRVADLEVRIEHMTEAGTGIGHTRWATHGVPSQINAHPHTDCTRKVAVIHNGIIENFMELKSELMKGGHKFKSDTDTEVIPHMIEEELNKQQGMMDAFRKVVNKLEGSYAILAIIEGKNEIYFARKHSPLVIGLGRGENFLASDVIAFLPHTRCAVFVKDGDIGWVNSEKIYVEADGNKVERPFTNIEWSAEDAMKGGYPHFMLKEIYEQPDAVANTLLDARIEQLATELGHLKELEIVAAGTSYHAGLAFMYASDLKTRLLVSSEFRALYKGGDVLAISQSGETADTLQAVRQVRAVNGGKVFGLVNVNGSTLTRLADQTVYTHAGPEIGVAATKTFTSQLAVLYGIDAELKGKKIPTFDIESALRLNGEMKKLSIDMSRRQGIFYIGRGPSSVTAREGALKMKELAYIQAEAYEGGELKHGPLALIEEGVPVVAVCPNDIHRKKMIGSIEEVKARGGVPVVFGEAGDKELKVISDRFYGLPATDPFYSPLTYVVPLQLLAYHTAVLLGWDPDKPRNLAKSVTVE